MTGWKISYFHFIYFVLALLNDIPIKMARVDKVSLQLLATALRTTQQQTPTKTTDDYQLPKFHGITKAKTLVNTSSVPPAALLSYGKPLGRWHNTINMNFL